MILFNSAAKGGRLIAHFDGKKSDVNWGIHVKKDDCIQRWDLHMSGSFMISNHTDRNKVVQTNLNPFKLMQYHSPLTSARKLSDALCSFFDAQRDLCNNYERPLMIKTDCALQLMTAILLALKFDRQDAVT